MEHTKEPWRIDVWTTAEENDEEVFISDNISGNIAVMLKNNPYRIDRELIHANATRIVACVNACAGISTGELWEIASHKQMEPNAN